MFTVRRKSSAAPKKCKVNQTKPIGAHLGPNTQNGSASWQRNEIHLMGLYIFTWKAEILVWFILILFWRRHFAKFILHPWRGRRNKPSRCQQLDHATAGETRACYTKPQTCFLFNKSQFFCCLKQWYEKKETTYSISLVFRPDDFSLFRQRQVGRHLNTKSVQGAKDVLFFF